LLVHLPNSKDDPPTCAVVVFSVFSWFFHWAVGCENLECTEKLFQSAYVLLYFRFLAAHVLMMAVLLSAGLHNDEISSGIHLITSRELTSRS